MAKSHHLRSLLFLLSSFLCLVRDAESFEWTYTINNDAVISVCHGQDLILPWNVSSNSPNIYTIQWYYQGLSKEVIAMMANGHFLPSPAFSGRVEFLPKNGIILKNILPDDKGNYSVEVLSQAGIERQNVVVEISDGISTSSGDLDLQQDRTAVRHDITGEWSVQLTCGHFTLLGHPPVDVVWTIPSGGAQQSTNYNGGNFHLILPNPVRGGNYSCAIAPQSPAATCLPESSPLLRKVVVNVDENGARLSLIEARQVELLSSNQLQSETNAYLSSYIHSLEDKDAKLTSQVHSLTTQVHYLEVKDANLTSQILRLQENTGIRVRLVGGSEYGRVEVSINGEAWGTVCDDYWDNHAANVVCRMLSYRGGDPFEQAHYGQGTGNILLDDVSCDGTEDNLLHCQHSPIGTHNCGHGEDAGVVCWR